jgi:hypothetical protein
MVALLLYTGHKFGSNMGIGKETITHPGRVQYHMDLDIMYGLGTTFGLITMKTLYTLLSLAPAPLFFLGFLWSLFNMHGLQAAMCGGSHWEMPVMWLIMSLAHSLPWLLRWQQLNLSRN